MTFDLCWLLKLLTHFTTGKTGGVTGSEVKGSEVTGSEVTWSEGKGSQGQKVRGHMVIVSEGHGGVTLWQSISRETPQTTPHPRANQHSGRR